MNIGYTAPLNEENSSYNDMVGMTLKFVKGYLPPKKRKFYLNNKNTLLIEWPESISIIDNDYISED